MFFLGELAAELPLHSLELCNLRRGVVEEEFCSLHLCGHLSLLSLHCLLLHRPLHLNIIGLVALHLSRSSYVV